MKLTSFQVSMLKLISSVNSEGHLIDFKTMLSFLQKTKRYSDKGLVSTYNILLACIRGLEKRGLVVKPISSVKSFMVTTEGKEWLRENNSIVPQALSFLENKKVVCFYGRN